MQLSGLGLVMSPALCCLLLGLLPSGTSWDYSSNGDSWSALGACGGQLGGIQSPIDVPESAPPGQGNRKVIFKYPRFNDAVELYNNGYSLAMTLPEGYKSGFGIAGGAMELKLPNAQVFRLWQVNFHAPSEHLLNGKRQPLEVQLVHKHLSSDKIAIVVVLFADAGDRQNNFLNAFLGEGLPDKAWESRTINTAAAKAPLDFAEITRGSTYMAYSGSLTVPPCTNKVQYYIRKQTSLAGSSQLQAFTNVLKETCGPNGNYRTAYQGPAPVFEMASLDVSVSPNVPADIDKKPDDGFQNKLASSNLAVQCWHEADQEIADSFDHLYAGDSEAVRNAKAKYNYARQNIKAAISASSAAQRDLTYTKSLYGSSAGFCGCEKKGQWFCNHEPSNPVCEKCPTNPTLCASVVTGMTANGDQSCRAYCFSAGNAGAQLSMTGGASKADLYWKQFAARQNVMVTSTNVGAAVKAMQDVTKFAKTVLVEDCMKNGPKTPEKKSDVEKVLVYDKPVILPGGRGASPFVDANELSADASATQGGVPSKLAPNLHQADASTLAMPIIQDAPKKIDPTDLPGGSSVMATLTLPVSIDSMGDDPKVYARELADALANSAGISKTRIKVTEIDQSPVQELVLEQNSTVARKAAAPAFRLTGRQPGFLRAH